MIIKPLFDRVLVKEEDNNNKTKSGLLLPTSTQDKPIVAKVFAVGDGGLVDGNDVKMIVQTNDKIMFHKYSASEFEFEDEKYLIIKQSDILAILEK